LRSLYIELIVTVSDVCCFQHIC